MTASAAQFDLSQDPTQPVNARPFAAQDRQFVLVGAASQQVFHVQGTFDTADPPAEDSWYAVLDPGAMVGPSSNQKTTDRALAYRISGFGTAGDAKLWVGADEPQSGLKTESTFLVAGEGDVTFYDVINGGSVRAIGGHVEIAGTAVGTLSCEITSLVDGTAEVHIRSLKADGTVETGDESAVNVFLQ